MRTWLALLVSATLLLASCGEDSSDGDGEARDAASSPTAESTSEPPAPTPDPTADWPACGEVWKDGAVLSGKYRGCRDGDEAIKADSVRCEFGKRMVTFGDHFFAVPDFRRGSRVFIHRTEGQVLDDPGYRDARASCMG